MVGLAMAADVPHSFGTGGVISATKFNENFTYIANRLWDLNGSNLYYNGGNVGVGTTDPAVKLEVKASAHPGATPLIRASAYSTSSAIDLIGLDMYSNYPSADYSVAQLVYGHGGAYVNPAFNIQVADSPKVLQTRMTIDSTGDVGIGTTAPDKLLHLQKGSDETILHLRSGGTNGSVYTGIEFAAQHEPKAAIYFQRGFNAGSGGNGFWSTGSLVFATDSVHDDNPVSISDVKMVIDHDGNVGIGTTNPLSLLTVGDNPTSGGILSVVGSGTSTGAEIQQTGSTNILNLRNASTAVMVVQNVGNRHWNYRAIS